MVKKNIPTVVYIWNNPLGFLVFYLKKLLVYAFIKLYFLFILINENAFPEKKNSINENRLFNVILNNVIKIRFS